MLLDAIICLLAVLFMLSGYRRGLILELGSIAGFFAGIAVAAAVWFPVAIWLHQWVTNDVGAAVAAFVLVFLAVYAGIAMAAGLLRKAAHMVFLGWLDAIGGAFAGLLKAAFVVVLGLLLLPHLPATAVSQLTAGSRIAPWVQGQHSIVAVALSPFTAHLPVIGALF